LSFLITGLIGLGHFLMVIKNDVQIYYVLVIIIIDRKLLLGIGDNWNIEL